jgi:hypothetical protein
MPQAPLPYDMFELARSAEEARRADKLSSIYHRGQMLAWNGRDVLAELVARHGPPQVDPDTRRALQRVFAILMWGELAAWRISAQLADRLVALEPKMAATSQAHDEARHFYVLHDYLALLGDVPGRPDPAAEAVLEMTLRTHSVVEKLLGMQLLIENIALTIFHHVRVLGVEPVLCDLLAYYEKDEARHVGLGVQALPDLLRAMSLPEGLKLLAFQLRLITNVLRSLKSIEPDLRALGIPAREIIEHGTGKMEHTTQLMFTELGVRTTAGHELTKRTTGAIVELAFPPPDAASFGARLAAAVRVLRHGPDVTPVPGPD